MSKQHTPGPMTQGTTNEGKACVWLGGATEPEHEMGPDTTWIDCNTEANARRVAACWNACDGIPTAWLEGGAADIIEHSIALIKQRDELLDALKKCDEQLSRLGFSANHASAAIAKATNQ